MKTKITSILLIFSLMMAAGCGVPNPQNPGTTKNGGSATADMKEITVAGSGGKIERVIRDIVAPKFYEKYGVKINFVAGLSGEILSKVELQKQAPQIDIAIFAPLDVLRAKNKDLIEEIDPAVITNVNDLDDIFVPIDKTTSVPVFGHVNAPAYNTKTFEQNNIPPIVSWNDISRPEYKGKTAFADIASDLGLTILYNLAFANGGSLENIEPGFVKAKELAGYSDTFYKNSTQMIPAMQQGAADVTVNLSYVIAELSNLGAPFKMVIPKEGAPIMAFNACIVKNTPRKQVAEQLVNELISEEIQMQTAESGFYPVRKGMKIPQKYESVIGLKESDKLFKPDVYKLNEIRAKWADRWAKEVTPELGKRVKK